MSTKTVESEAWTRRIHAWDTDFASIVARTDLANAQARAKQDLWMKELRAARDNAQKKLREFSDAEGAAAAQLRPELDRAWLQMQHALGKVKHDLGIPESGESA
ncbi:MAG: hypothetical protein JNM76_16415 [Betaproteobacteria bacterium]|nr:hypothetical protein [Betaproteobacteria bacterium]